jgi:hypothetical protein
LQSKIKKSKWHTWRNDIFAWARNCFWYVAFFEIWLISFFVVFLSEKCGLNGKSCFPPRRAKESFVYLNNLLFICSKNLIDFVTVRSLFHFKEEWLGWALFRLSLILVRFCQEGIL